MPEKKSTVEGKDDSQSLIKWGLFQNNQGNIIAHVSGMVARFL